MSIEHPGYFQSNLAFIKCRNTAISTGGGSNAQTWKTELTQRTASISNFCDMCIFESGTCALLVVIVGILFQLL